MNRFFLFILFSFLTRFSVACTSIIVSGMASVDGRPFIFKNRDVENWDVVTASFQGERYYYVAVINNKDLKLKRVGSGFNEAGFSIINTDGNNLNVGKEDNGNNTKVMRRALEICATLKDFEKLLDTLPRPRHLNSNFGVMDAEGRVAYYEANSKSYVKYDVNDPNVAPKGYLIRTNYGMSGDLSRGSGYERYKAMEMFIDGVMRDGKISSEDVIRKGTRYLTHGESKINLLDLEPEDAKMHVFVDFTNFIPRRHTANAQLIQGVKPGENPLETVAWTICGSPHTTVCIPIWITANHKLPKILSFNDDGHSAMSDAGLELKKRLFPTSKQRKTEEIDIAQLTNRAGTGILQQIEPIEDVIFRKSRRVSRAIRRRGYAGKRTERFYKWLDSYVPTEYNKRFGMESFSDIN